MTKRLPFRSPSSCIRERRQRGFCTPCRAARAVLEFSCRQSERSITHWAYRSLTWRRNHIFIMGYNNIVI